MKLGVFVAMFRDIAFETMLDYVAEKGVQVVEINCGGYVGDTYCKPAELLSNNAACTAFAAAIESRGLKISALSAHANPLHPNPVIGDPHRAAVTNAIRLAEKLGVDTVVTFSGCPGGGPDDKTPNWVTCPWPTDFSHTVKWQWETVLLPYWHVTARFAQERGVRIAIEMHPGFCVYNPETARALRDAIGSNVGTNFDPSHLFWQSADPVHAIRALGDSIYHFHAKDTVIDPVNAAMNGVLDTKSYADFSRRSWIFRTVGYGHSEEVWRAMMSNLQLVGYQGAVSIEHEDGLMSQKEGFEKAVNFLKTLVIQDRPGQAFWA
jgi:sugar phosphate isomerase/epimerase